MTEHIEQQTKDLIDNLKATCAHYGMGNDGNEYKIITQVFLYKFLNDKFGYEVKQTQDDEYRERIASYNNWEDAIAEFTQEELDDLCFGLTPGTPKMRKEHLLSYVFNNQNHSEFGLLFDSTMVDIATYNAELFSMHTDSKTKITIFEAITVWVTDPAKRNDFARALVSKLANFNFEVIFEQKYDFFSTIFEYLIKDYNKDGGGKYAEYYTPHSVATIMAQLMVAPDEEVQDVSCYDPSSGSGTLLMAIAHAIGEEKCSIYSQDISQKSSKMLRLNLILNNLVHSIQNVIQGDTLVTPYHREANGSLKKFDFIVSNPPFKLDFSDSHARIASQEQRFFAGVPKIANKKKDSMAIYLCFLQHIIGSLSDRGRAAIVVPTGFITANSTIEKAIRRHIIENKMLRGVVSMPSNIFATTNTNVSVIILDKNNRSNPVLIDATKLGEVVKEDGNQRTRLSIDDVDKIVETFHQGKKDDKFSVSVSFDEIAERDYSFSAGQYFDVKIEYDPITAEEFETKMDTYKCNLKTLFNESRILEDEIIGSLTKIQVK